MSDQPDRVAMASDLAVVAARLTDLEKRVSEEGAAVRQHVETRITEESAAIRQHVGNRITEEGAAIRQHVENRITEEGAAIRQHVEQRITEEGVTTRRHFDIIAERVEESVKLVAEVTAHHSTVLDNHETRIQKIEKRRA